MADGAASLGKPAAPVEPLNRGRVRGYFGQPCSTADDIARPMRRNETRSLSLMSAFQVDSATAQSGSGRRSQPVDATLYLEREMECGLMVHRFHRGFTAAEKTELWDRWKRGESLKAIGRAFGKQSSSIYFLVAPHGGIRPA